MWIRRTEFDALVKRVNDLERRKETFTVYDAVQAQAYLNLGFGRPIDSQEIPVKTVVERIMDKLGMRLEYIRGQPARVEITDPPSAASHASHTEEK